MASSLRLLVVLDGDGHVQVPESLGEIDPEHAGDPEDRLEQHHGVGGGDPLKDEIDEETAEGLAGTAVVPAVHDGSGRHQTQGQEALREDVGREVQLLRETSNG